MKNWMRVMVFVLSFSLAAAFGNEPIDSPGDGAGVQQKWRAWSVPIDLLWWLRR